VLFLPDAGERRIGRRTQLSRIESAVASLQALLDRPPSPIPVEHRTVPAVTALAITDRVTTANLEIWWADAFDELHTTVRAAGAIAGIGGGLFPGELFEAEVADVVAFLPVGNPVSTRSRAQMVEIPAAELVVAIHRGPFAELDRTYAAVGTHVTERELGIDGPIREYYLVTAAETPDESQHRIEVCWPIFQTVAR
jgi:effector-binding domain-containing protein